MIKNKLKKIRRLKKIQTKKVLLWFSIILVFSLSLGTIARYYASSTVEYYNVATTITGDEVVVNDQVADWNYYTSLNYTEVTDKTKFPSYEEREAAGTLYNQSSLVAVELIYDSTDINNPELKGYVSSLVTERQSKYKYYKYYPVDKETNTIKIELLDNPWGMRPNGYGFNGWVCDTYNETDCGKYKFSYDNQYYTRYLTVEAPTPNSNGVMTLSLRLKTSWVLADIKSDISQLGNYKNKGMISLTDSSNVKDDIETKENKNMTGFYYYTAIAESDNTTGLYYDVNGNQCTSSNICTGNAYKLIQNSDTSISTYNSDNASNYYYMVTRDTNIFELPDDSATLDQFAIPAPLTVTSSHNGSNSVSRKITQVSTTTQSDLTFENITLIGGNEKENISTDRVYSGNDSFKTLFAEYNLKMGRNIKAENDNKYDLDSIIGGYNIKTIIESGFYHKLLALPATKASDGKIHNEGIYGCDYDRVTNNNNNLIVNYQVASSTSFNHNNENKTTSTMIAKSGSFGIGGLTISPSSSSEMYDFGIYVGAIRGQDEVNYIRSLRTLKVEGGKIFNINGGAFIEPGLKDVTIAIYITGGEIESAVSGAGTAISYGGRIMSVSGGRINNAVAAGSNSYAKEGASGPLRGDTLLYIGGNAKIGGETMYLSNTSTIYGVEKRGSAFGAGLGQSSDNTLGRVDNSSVIINGGEIDGDVYGGGNYGATGLDISKAKTSVTILDGIIKGSVFGGSNNNGFGNPDSEGTININMSGGTVEYIYGGSNSKGLVSGDVTINLSGGTINKAVFGGGYGQETKTNGFININTTGDTLTINKDDDGGSIYGGSANGSTNKTVKDPEAVNPAEVQLYRLTTKEVIKNNIFSSVAKAGDMIQTGTRAYTFDSKPNRKCTSVPEGFSGCPVYRPLTFGTTDLDENTTYYHVVTHLSENNIEIPDMKPVKISLAADRGNINVNIDGGAINGGVFGGGLGNKATPEIYGTINVEVHSGKVEEVYAGNNIKGKIDKETADFKVTIYGGEVNNVFGGSKGKNAGAKITNVDIRGGQVNNVYGGGKEAPTDESLVQVKGGRVNGSVYGGGYKAGVTTTTVNILDGANINNVFGGSNEAGKVETATVNNNGGEITGSVYGGGNIADVTNSFNYLNGTKINNAFAGGASSNVTEKAVLLLNAGEVTNIFGGSDRDKGVGYSDVQLRNGTVTNVYGGNNEGGIFKEGLLDIEPSADGILKITNVYGGSKGANATSEHTNVKIVGKMMDENSNENRLTIGDIFGGGYEAITKNYTNLYIRNVTVNDIFAGGFRGPVYGETNVNIIDNVKANNVYGGGHYAFVGYANYNPGSNAYVEGAVPSDSPTGSTPVPGKTYVNIVSADITKNVYGSGNASFVYGDTNVNIGDNAITKIEEQINNAADQSYIKEFKEPLETIKPNPKINIGGNVFGGSEQNASEKDIFDDTFKGVIGKTKVNISGEKYVKTENNKETIDLVVKNSIYGGGNSSGIIGTSNVLINRLGVENAPAEMTSIQRATNAYVVDSHIKLEGMRDRAYETGTEYSIIRIENLYLLGNSANTHKKGSTLYLDKSTTFLFNYTSGEATIDVANTSIVGEPILETVSENVINEELNVKNVQPQNVDNRIYVYESLPTLTFAVISGEIPSVENTTSNGGSIRGMSFFGIYYYNSGDDTIQKGIYDESLTAGEQFDVTGHETSYASVFGKHDYNLEEQKTKHGFFTNYYRISGNQVSIDYIEPSPNNSAYYRWALGSDILTIQVPMEANKYSQRSAVNANLQLEELLENPKDSSAGYWKNARIKITGVDASHFHSENQEYVGTLVDKSTIPTVNTEGTANNTFALSMGTTTTGWMSNFQTDFYSRGKRPTNLENVCSANSYEQCTGNNTYIFDSSTDLRTLSFWLYYSENLDLSKVQVDPDETESDGTKKLPSINMGYIIIKGEIEKYNDDLTSSGELRELAIQVFITITEGTADSYGALKSPGKKYDIFQDRNISISADGSFSLYQKLSLNLNKNIAGTDEMWSVENLYNGSIVEKEVNLSGGKVKQYWGPSYRYLTSDYAFPVGTRISMIDLITNEEYFYEVTNKDNITYEDKQYKYYLRDFAKMGCTNLYDSSGNRIEENFYSDDMIGEKWKKKYYNEKEEYAVEKFIFIVDLSGTGDYPIGQTSETHHLYLTLARDVASSIDESGNLVNPSSEPIIIPRGQPDTDLQFTLNPRIDSLIKSDGVFYDPITKEQKESYSYDNNLTEDDKIYSVYDDADNLQVKLETILNQSIGNDSSLGIVDTQYDDYRVGAKISIQRLAKDEANLPIQENGKYIYEDTTEELNGLVVTSRSEKYYPYTDGSIRLQLAGRITDIGSLINFDFSNSDLNYGRYRLKIETFVSNDGLYYGTVNSTGSSTECPAPGEKSNVVCLEFELADSDYGLEVKTDPSSTTHDVKNGQDENGNNTIDFNIETKNGLKHPNLKVSLERRKYNSESADINDAIYNTEYETINIKDLFDEISLFPQGDENNIIKKDDDIFNACLMETILIPQGTNEEGEELPPLEESKCSNIYSLGNISMSKRQTGNGQVTDESINYTLRVKLRNGPSDTDKANQAQAKWRSGTYRLVIYLYDDVLDQDGQIVRTNLIGKTYDYIIIRSLDIGGEDATDAPSPEPTEP